MSDKESEPVEVATVSWETPLVTAAIGDQLSKQSTEAIIDQLRKQPIDTAETIYALREIERKLRANYADSERIVVPVSNGATIHHDFSRKVTIPDFVKHPKVALVDGEPLQVGSIKVAPVISSRTGEVVRAGYEIPIYAAAGDDGQPLRDSKGDYIVIDPQTGAIRQRVRVVPTKKVVVKRTWLRTQWDRFVAWLTRAR